MNMRNCVGMLLILTILSGCVEDIPDMQLHNYQGEVISMNLNHAKTTKFCQAVGYNTAEQWIIGEKHSGMYGRKVGYDLWGMDGHFNSNDRRVHVDCKGTSTQDSVYTIQYVDIWLNKINVSMNIKSNNTYDQFCQQENMNFKDRNNNKVTCSRSFDVSKEYTPQEIAMWYIQKGES